MQADVLHRAEIPLIPADLVARLRGLVPGREALAALTEGETVEAEIIGDTGEGTDSEAESQQQEGSEGGIGRRKGCDSVGD